MRNTFILFFLHINLFIFSQDTLRLFYDINQKQLTANHHIELDAFLKKTDTLSSFKINGYADYLSSDIYNIELSQQRADNVKGYLIQNKHLHVKTCVGLGEIKSMNNSPLGNQIDRRVDIIVEHPLLLTSKTPIKKDTVKQKVKTVSLGNALPTLEDELLKTTTSETIELDGVSFVPGEHYPLPASMPVLDELLHTLEKNTNLKIEIQGHICCQSSGDGVDRGTGEIKLSVNRAKFIYDYLIQKGMSANRLTYVGYGASRKKVNPELTEDDAQQNRRVEIKILEK